MSCSRCDEYRTSGERFCPFCGEELRNDCPECESQRLSGAKFCMNCGKRLSTGVPSTPAHEGPGTIRKILFLLVPVIGILLLIEIGCMILGVGDVWAYVGAEGITVIALLPELVAIGRLEGLAAQGFWIFIFVAILASLAIALLQSKKCMERGDGAVIEKVERTHFYSICYLFTLMTMLSLIISGLLALTGNGIEIPDSMPKGNTAESLYAFAEAAVWEEIIARVVYIGLPMAIAALILGRKEWGAYILGGFGMSKLALLLLVISSIIFGMAHGGGWGWEKILPSTVAGFIIGYAFIKYGVHASIMMHFLTDYLSVTLISDLMPLTTPLVLLMLTLGLVVLIDTVLKVRGWPATIRNTPDWVPDYARRSDRTEKD